MYRGIRRRSLLAAPALLLPTQSKAWMHGSASILNLASLITNTTQYATPSIARPAYLTPYTDSVFGTKVTRITGNDGTAISGLGGNLWGTDVHHHYSSDQAWNCDQSLIYIDTNKDGGGSGALFLDGQDYTPKYMASIPWGGTSDVRWDATLPHIMRVTGGGASSNQYGTWDVTAGANFNVTKTFSGYTAVKYGNYKGCFALDGESVLMTAIRNSDSKMVCFKYKVSTNTQGADIDTTSFGTGAFSSAKITPDGLYGMLTYDDDSHAIIRMSDGVNVSNIAASGTSHTDLIQGIDGVQYSVGRGPSGGNAVKLSIPGLVSTTIDSSGGYCDTTSARAQNVHQYFVSNYYDNRPSNEPLEDELVMFDLITPKRYRLCHTHFVGNPNPDYEVQCHGSMSPDAGRVIFCSPWDNPAAIARPGCVYVVDIRK